MKYAYECKKCHWVFTKEIRLSEYSEYLVPSCPKCKSRKTKRIYRDIAAAIFIGEGFTKSTREEE